jgi:hypothetical protein
MCDRFQVVKMYNNNLNTLLDCKVMFLIASVCEWNRLTFLGLNSNLVDF